MRGSGAWFQEKKRRAGDLASCSSQMGVPVFVPRPTSPHRCGCPIARIVARSSANLNSLSARELLAQFLERERVVFAVEDHQLIRRWFRLARKRDEMTCLAQRVV
jgi:hypothetical protein